ncbi:MAG: PH domain-containing protein [Planctomycetaceae bacterium]|nr:PH domain-containing protein [Planctomycetaceae bacterium]
MSDSTQDEPILYEAHPAMFRNNPVWFVVCMLLSLVGVGLILLLIWYLQTRATTLIVTNEQTTLRKGLLSKETNDVFHENVRNIQVKQSFFQRMMGVGYIGISSSGQAGLEIEVNGIPDPDRVKEIIDDHRHPG